MRTTFYSRPKLVPLQDLATFHFLCTFLSTVFLLKLLYPSTYLPPLNMPFKNITNEFREVLQERESSIPDAKRRKVLKQPKNETNKPSVDKIYIAEAYNIVRL